MTHNEEMLKAKSQKHKLYLNHYNAVQLVFIISTRMTNLQTVVLYRNNWTQNILLGVLKTAIKEQLKSVMCK